MLDSNASETAAPLRTNYDDLLLPSWQDETPEPSLFGGSLAENRMRLAERAGQGNAQARWMLEGVLLVRAFANAGLSAEVGVIAAIVILFEIAVLVTRGILARMEPTRAIASRVAATRWLVIGASLLIAIASDRFDDIWLLFLAVFVAFAGFVAAAYIPDALFEERRLIIDTSEAS